MTYKTNARLAGFMFLFYTAATLAQGVLLGPIISGAGVAAKLANISQHVTSMSLVIVLSMATILAALFLAVTLYAITRDEDGDLALLARCCRLAEGVFNVFPALAWTGLLWLGSEMRTTGGLDRGSNGYLVAQSARVEHERRCNLLRRGQHAFLLSFPEGPKHPRPSGLARRSLLHSNCGGNALGVHGIHQRTLVSLDADSTVRIGARVLAADQGRA